ncbi:MAG: PilN domain-containing protein [Deltaproteobacteria bacterium]|nr:PilN domain-containing protein [Deltaproteobacteria bacterium]
MIRINLLPYHEKAKKANLARQVIIIVGSLSIFLFIVAVIQAVMMASIYSLKSDIKEKEAQLAVLTKIIGDIDKAKADKKLLELKLSAVTALEKNRLYPVRLLDEITSLVPAQDIWLDKVTQTGNSLQLQGVGRDNIAISRFMKTVETSKFVESVEILSSKQVNLAEMKLQEFTFSCVLRKGI